MVVPNIAVSRMAPVNVYVFRTPVDDQPDEEAYVLLPGRRLIEAGGKAAGCWANHKDLRSSSKSCICACGSGDLVGCAISICPLEL
jgi:hypothetical protein